MEPKKNDTDNYIGVEIECYGRLTHNQLADIFEENDMDDWVSITNDWSIRVPQTISHRVPVHSVRTGEFLYDEQVRPTGTEVQVLLKENEINTKLKKVFKILNDNKFKINKSCGIHVHIDMRNREERIPIIYSNLVNCSTLMKKLQRKIRRGSSYAQQNKETELWRAAINYDITKYRIINAECYRHKKTFEVRIHHGSLDFLEVAGWIRFLITIVNKKDTIKNPVTNVKEFKKYVSKNKVINSYVRKRYKQFNKAG